MAKVIGRTAELEKLKEATLSDQSELIAIYGRRRIGKTFLVDQFLLNLENDPSISLKLFKFSLSANSKHTTAESIKQFNDALKNQFGIKLKSSRTWIENFENLSKSIESKKDLDKVILFLDEFPYFQKETSNFLKCFETWWQNYGSKNPKIVFIISGSSVSWMLKKVVKENTDMHKRVTVKIPLKPFSIKETYEYLLHRGFLNITKKEVLEVYMAMGGVAEYLRKLDKGLDIHANINNIFFDKSGFLNEEYDELLKGLFGKYEQYKKIIDCLLNYPEGMSFTNLRDELGQASNTEFYEQLDDLEKTDFITKRTVYKPKNGHVYKLSDPFIIFYKKWVHPFNSQRIEDKDYWTKVKANNDFSKWAGLAFENLCFANIESIKNALGISGMITTSSSFLFKPSEEEKKQGIKGSQIDLLLDRDDNKFNLFECKFHSTVWDIKDHERDNIINKETNMKKLLNTEREVIRILISVYGAKRNDNFNSSFSKELFAENLFF